MKSHLRHSKDKTCLRGSQSIMPYDDHANGPGPDDIDTPHSTAPLPLLSTTVDIAEDTELSTTFEEQPESKRNSRQPLITPEIQNHPTLRTHSDVRRPLLQHHSMLINYPIPDLAPPPYTSVEDLTTRYPSAPPFSDLPPAFTLAQPGYPTDTRLPQPREPKDDLDFFRYSAPCKKIATCIATIIGLIVILVLILLLAYGKL